MLRSAGLLLAAACSGSVSEPSARGDSGGAADSGVGGTDEERPTGVWMDTVEWSLVWDADDLEAPTQGGAWQVSRQDGARLELHRGWMVLSTVVVESCELWNPARVPPPHGRPDHESGLPAPVALSLHEPTDQRFAPAPFPAEEVCGVWLVSFQGGETLTNPPPELEGIPDADLATLAWWAEVSVQAPGAEAWTDLVIGSPLQFDADVRPDWLDESGTTATITLDPALLLRDLTLPVQDPGLAGFEALNGMVQSATVRIDVAGPTDDTGTPPG